MVKFATRPKASEIKVMSVVVKHHGGRKVASFSAVLQIYLVDSIPATLLAPQCFQW